MKNYALEAWAYLVKKISFISGIVAAVSNSLIVALREKDIAKVKAHSLELRELGQKMIDTSDFLDEAVSDGNLDLYEGSQALVLLNDLLDEGEDVITGVDEDDA